MINKILIRTSDRKTLHKDRRSLGMNGENLQEVLLFCLDEKIEGNGIVEVELPDGTKGMIEVDRTEEGYELPVKSSLLTQTGFVKFQLRILHDNEEIFKSEIIALEVKDSINATETIPEQYLTWIDTLTNLKQDLEKSESERVSNENERISAEEARQENFTEMQETISSAVSNIKNLTEEYNTNAEKETKKFNDNAVEQTKTFNDNSDSRLAEYDKNHTDKMKEYDGNAIAKLDAYNENDTDKTNAYNANDITKTKAYNDNTVLKEKAFNDIVTESTEAFNTNVEQKETELENLAEEKINEYNQVSAELTAKVEQVQAENKLIKEQIPSATASGNNIHIEDSSNLDFEWKVKSGHRQATREGYNCFQIPFASKTVSGVTITTNEDKSIVANGTMTATWIIFEQQDITDILEDLQTYTVWQKNYSTELKGIYLQVRQVEIEDETKVTNYFSANKKVTFTVDKSKYKYTINLQTSGTIETFNNYTNAYMLYKGTDDKAYEQYGASPSPNYSSEIETVGSNVNLLENKTISQTLSGVDFLVKEDKSIIVNGTSTDRINFVLSSNNKLKAGTYTLSGCPDGGSITSYHLDVALIGTKTYLIDNGSSNTSKLDNDLDNLTYRILIEKGVTLNSVVFKPKLEEGVVATPYSLFGMGSVEANIISGNIFDIKKTGLTTRTARGVTITLDQDGTITVNGTATDNNNFTFTFNRHYFEFYKGQKYTIFQQKISGEATGLLATHFNFYNEEDKLTWGWLSVNGLNASKIAQKTANERGYAKTFILYIVKGVTYANYKIKLMVLEGDYTLDTVPEHIEHQSQTAIMPIQQEMLEGDYVAGVEHHEWKKVVLDGTENWREITTNNLKRFFYEVNVASINDNNSVNCSSNYFKGTSRNKLEHSSGDEVSVADRFLNILSKKIETKEDFKAWLKSKYDEGNPVVVYYKLATPLNLELTEGQKAIRDTKLYTYKNITNIDVSDELASIDVEYKKDLDLEHEKLQNQIDEIRQLISTTETSALLLDNLQKDAESEVK